jgi:UMF1 family MFS transporter
MSEAPGHPSHAAPSVTSRRARVSWAFFDWAQQPYNMLVVGFVFGPYFASDFIGDPERGQSMLGYAISLSGLLIILLSPLVGASIDSRRNPKTWLAVLSIPFVIACSTLWLAEPGAAALLPLIFGAMVIASTSTELSITAANSMLPYVAEPGRMGRLSGWSTGLGYFAALLSVALTLFILPGLLGLDEAQGETARVVGPLAAAWYLLFVIPLFLFVPRPPRLARVEGSPLAELWTTLRGLPRNRVMLTFLLGRMLVGEGTNAAGLFGPVLAKGLFGWTVTETGVFGLVLALVAGVSSWAAGRLDDRLGSKRTVLIFAALLATAVAGFALIEPDRLFGLAVDPARPGDGLFASPAERAFIACGILIGTAFGPIGAVLRTWMARLSPPGEEGRWFGLFALSGRASSFFVPALIGLLTELTDDQRVLIPVVLAFLLAGAGFLAVTPGARPGAAAPSPGARTG